MVPLKNTLTKQQRVREREAERERKVCVCVGVGLGVRVVVLVCVGVYLHVFICFSRMLLLDIEWAFYPLPLLSYKSAPTPHVHTLYMLKLSQASSCSSKIFMFTRHLLCLCNSVYTTELNCM